MRTIVFVRTTNIYDDSRATKEIMALEEAGYRLIILGWDRNGKAEEKTHEVFANFNVECRFFHCILPMGIGMRNFDKLIQWTQWTKSQLKRIPAIYAVHACNLDGGIGAYLFCKKKSIPLFYDIYDYYIDSHNIPLFVKKYVERVEIKIINSAYATIICTEERKEQIKKSNPQRIIVIHNSPEVPMIELVDSDYDYAYCGSLCDMRLIKEVLEKYMYHNGLKFVFAGNDKYQKDVEDLSRKYENLDYLGTIPYSKVLEVEKRAKVLSAIYNPSIRNHQLCAPNKFYEALALGKPLIVCKGTGIDKVVERERLGVVIEYDAGEFYEALDYLCNNPEECRNMGNRGRLLYEKKFKWSLMKQKLISIYESIR